jgi:hypothetical protein
MTVVVLPKQFIELHERNSFIACETPRSSRLSHPEDNKTAHSRRVSRGTAVAASAAIMISSVGALDARAGEINDRMKIACAVALAHLARAAVPEKRQAYSWQSTLVR